MASIRRTLSPYHDRPYPNGGSPFTVHSPSHKLLFNGKFGPSSSETSLVARVRRFLDGVFLNPYSRKNTPAWKRSLYRCSLFFFFGVLFGMMPFGHVQDIRNHDFSFEVKTTPVNVELDRDLDIKHVEFVVDTVSLGSEKRSIFEERFDFVPRKQLIVVTPTYNRALQAYYLNRLAQVLRLVPAPLLWVVVEMNSASMETAGILRKTGVVYRHLVCKKNLTNIKDRGVHQRNTALEHIEHHKLNGIVYFADDDNIYSLELFENLRGISRFGTWPVAMLAQSKNKAILEGPVCNGSQVVGWHTNEKSKRVRRFHVDMSGFAFNSTILWDPKSWRRPFLKPIRQLDSMKEGFQETTFIEQIVEDESKMEGLPSGCSKILNWHLHLEANNFVYPKGWLLRKNLDAVLRIQ